RQVDRLADRRDHPDLARRQHPGRRSVPGDRGPRAHVRGRVPRARPRSQEPLARARGRRHDHLAADPLEHLRGVHGLDARGRDAQLRALLLLEPAQPDRRDGARVHRLDDRAARSHERARRPGSIRPAALIVPGHVSPLRIAALAVVLAGCAAADSSPTSPATVAGHSSVEFSAWEPASFERAASEDKLILINVIATWCHWCHVMDEQTFANPEVAALLAEHFVVIRVDSDARPDVSERYRAWGWPATAFLSPRAEPVLNLRGYRDPAVFAALLRELIAEHQRGELRRL